MVAFFLISTNVRIGGVAGMARAPRKTIIKPDEGLKQLEELRYQAGDLGVARQALDNAVSMTRGLWISFISLSAYLMVAVGSVTHVDLFLENPLELPLVGVKVPLVVFFWLAPILYIIIHSYLLLNLKLMSDNVRDWLARLEYTLAKESDAQERHRIAQAHKLSLPNFFPVQMLAGPRINQVGIMRWGLASAVMLTIIVAPVFLLFLVQAQFLPYHQEAVTWVHRIAILLDMMLLWYFWPRIRGVRKFKERWFLKLAAIAGSIFLATLSLFLAAFPGESIYIRDLRYREVLFEGLVNNVTGFPRSPMANRLILTNKDFVDLDNTELAKGNRTISLRGRQLQQAVLVDTDLRNADFTAANLEGADLSLARLEGANFECAKDGIGHSDQCTTLNRARFAGASLKGASFHSALLRGAELSFLQAEGASFQYSDLSGAFLSGSFIGANFNNAQLAGASLIMASLQGVDFRDANLKGAWLSGANLTGAVLDGADLSGATLPSSCLYGTTWTRTILKATFLHSANLERISGLAITNSPNVIGENNDIDGKFEFTCMSEEGNIIVDREKVVSLWVSKIPNGKLRDLAAKRFSEIVKKDDGVDKYSNNVDDLKNPKDEYFKKIYVEIYLINACNLNKKNIDGAIALSIVRTLINPPTSFVRGIPVPSFSGPLDMKERISLANTILNGGDKCPSTKYASGKQIELLRKNLASAQNYIAKKSKDKYSEFGPD
jgi:uncharacterized protein YjbI with pentapeptide repeats